MISLNLSDDDDVSLRRQSLICQINTVLCRFGRLDPTVKNRLFPAHCSSHRGSELWNLNCNKITEYCSTWRKGLRRIWELPYKFRSDYLSAISGISPIYDELCRRFLNFITKCYSSDSKLIRFVIGHAIYCARVQSHVVVIKCCVTRGMVPRLKTNLRLVSNLRAVVTTFP